ncbi:MAG: hypothetical protein EAZ94_00340 [Oscillatoriales cyanobacterium]|nr:MAG: hypothetical protein EAZ94_00340 [Oscillatoriales cyanobacterium]
MGVSAIGAATGGLPLQRMKQPWGRRGIAREASMGSRMMALNQGNVLLVCSIVEIYTYAAHNHIIFS